jgi:hypothetical protein
VSDDKMCVRCNKKPWIHEFICGDCLYDDLNKERERNSELTELVKWAYSAFGTTAVEDWDRVSRWNKKAEKFVY